MVTEAEVVMTTEGISTPISDKLETMVTGIQQDTLDTDIMNKFKDNVLFLFGFCSLAVPALAVTFTLYLYILR